MTIELVSGDLPKEWLHAAHKTLRVGMDTETTGLDYITDTLQLVQIHVPYKGTVMIRDLVSHPTQLARLLESPIITKIFHYATFDLHFLMNTFPLITPTRIADTKIAATLYDPKKTIFIDKVTNKGSHSLRVLVQNLFGYEMNKALAISNWGAAELSSEQLEYAAKDVEYLVPLLMHLESGILERSPEMMPHLYASYAYLPTKACIDLKIGRDVFSYQ